MAAGEFSGHLARFFSTPSMTPRGTVRRLKSLAREITDAIQVADEIARDIRAAEEGS